MFHVYRDKALRNVFLTNFTLYCSLTGSDVNLKVKVGVV